MVRTYCHCSIDLSKAARKNPVKQVKRSALDTWHWFPVEFDVDDVSLCFQWSEGNCEVTAAFRRHKVWSVFRATGNHDLQISKSRLVGINWKGI